MKPRFDDGSTKGKKKKIGFKVDRSKNYWDRVKGPNAKKNGGTGAASANKKQEEEKVQRVKAVSFDEKERKEYLLGLHKRKNERRVEAVIQRRRKHRQEQSKLRKELREEARQQYNTAAAVPILPNYQFQFPDELQQPEGEDGGEGGDQTFEDEYESGVTVSVQPLAMTKRSSVSRAASASNQEQQQQQNNKKRGSSISTSRIAEDFSDLPSSIQQRLERVKKEHKGETQQKLKVRTMKELKKLHKIKKHSKKGTGKKTKGGKRKNR